MKYYLVTGRICGDDEDTSRRFLAESRDEAASAFEDLMWDLKGTSKEDRARLESCDMGVFINGVFASESPIEDLT